MLLTITIYLNLDKTWTGAHKFTSNQFRYYIFFVFINKNRIKSP